MLKIVEADNVAFLRTVDGGSVDLIYVDPPFNTGGVRRHSALSTTRDASGDRVGFGGQRYRSEVIGTHQYDDSFDDYLGFLAPRLAEAYRVLAPTGSLFVHVDYREAHYVKVMLDGIFGRASFVNEIIWAYDYGARSKSRWSTKHDNIFWYVKDPKRYTFNYDAIDRIPYMAPGLVSAEKAARGKTPTDVWWQTIVPTNSKERTGYPTQKPLAIAERIVKVHSSPGDLLLDFFAGSGTFGEAAARHNRSCILIDDNPEAIEVMTARLAPYDPLVEAPADPPVQAAD